MSPNVDTSASVGTLHLQASAGLLDCARSSPRLTAAHAPPCRRVPARTARTRLRIRSVRVGSSGPIRAPSHGVEPRPPTPTPPGERSGRGRARSRSSTIRAPSISARDAPAHSILPASDSRSGSPIASLPARLEITTSSDGRETIPDRRLVATYPKEGSGQREPDLQAGWATASAGARRAPE